MQQGEEDKPNISNMFPTYSSLKYGQHSGCTRMCHPHLWPRKHSLPSCWSAINRYLPAKIPSAASPMHGSLSELPRPMVKCRGALTTPVMATYASEPEWAEPRLPQAWTPAQLCHLANPAPSLLCHRGWHLICTLFPKIHLNIPFQRNWLVMGGKQWWEGFGS